MHHNKGFRSTWIYSACSHYWNFSPRLERCSLIPCEDQNQEMKDGACWNLGRTTCEAGVEIEVHLHFCLWLQSKYFACIFFVAIFDKDSLLDE